MSTNDPFDRARAALDAAREARGAPEEEEPASTVDPRDPYSAAEAALRKAEEARKAAEGTKRRAEDRARKELERLKALAGHGTSAVAETGTASSDSSSSGDDDDDAADAVTEPRVRRRL